MLRVGSEQDLCEDCYEEYSKDYYLEFAGDDYCPENPYGYDDKSYHDRCSCTCECGTGYRTTMTDCISNYRIVGKWIDIHRQILADVAIGLKKLDLPVLVILEIAKHLLKTPKLKMAKEWEISKLVKKNYGKLQTHSKTCQTTEV